MMIHQYERVSRNVPSISTATFIPLHALTFAYRNTGSKTLSKAAHNLNLCQVNVAVSALRVISAPIKGITQSIMQWTTTPRAASIISLSLSHVGQNCGN